MHTGQTTKPEDDYVLNYWNKLEKPYKESWTKSSDSRKFVVNPDSKISIDKDGNTTGGVLVGLKDDSDVVSLMWVTPDQARAIATMLVYAAQEAEK